MISGFDDEDINKYLYLPKNNTVISIKKIQFPFKIINILEFVSYNLRPE